MPIGSIALNHQIPLRQVEIHDVPMKHPLGLVRLAEIVEYRLHSNLDAARSGIGGRDKDGTASRRAEPKPTHQRRLHHSDRATKFAGHRRRSLVQRMRFATNLSLRFSHAATRAMMFFVVLE